MTCRELERRLEAWLTGVLPPVEQAACERHAAACADCRDLVELAGFAGSSADEPPPDLVPAVLERTSGAACARTRDELLPLVDGELPPERRELVELHLDSCTACRAFHVVLAELPADLAALAEVDPGPGFVDGVMARTVKVETSQVGRRAVPSPLERLRRWWTLTWPRAVRRPRFAWEAAYVLVLLMMPLVASAGVPERAAELVGRAGRVGGDTIAGAARGVAETAEGAAERAGRLGEAAEGDLRTFRERLASSLVKGRDDGPSDRDDPNPEKGD